MNKGSIKRDKRECNKAEKGDILDPVCQTFTST